MLGELLSTETLSSPVASVDADEGGVHLCFFISSIFGVVLIIVDFVLVIVDLALAEKNREVGNALEAVSLTISFFFLIDVLLRVYVEGWVKRLGLHERESKRCVKEWCKHS